MSTTVTPGPGNQLWGIYYTDREYARLLGDPMRTVVEAPTKRAAEEAAGRLGFESPWAHPVTPEQARLALWIPRRKRHQRQLPARSIHTASMSDYANSNGTAIEVLKNLEERIDNHATFNMMQLPETRGGDDAAARIEAQIIEQIARVKTVMAQLESWRDELRQDRRQCVAQHV